MSQNQGDFTPVVKGGYKADGPLHRRNWKALSDFLRTNFVTNERLADGSIDEAKIQDLAVTNAKIESLAVDKLTAGQLTADVLLAGLLKTADSGQRVEIDSNGIRLNDGSQDTVNIPVSGDASFLGAVTAKSLSSDASTLRGSTQVDAGGSFVFTSGVADPTAAPTIAWTYTQVTTSVVPGTMRGIDFDATNSRVITCDPTNRGLHGYNSGTGVEEWSVDYSSGDAGFDIKPYGIVRLGSFIYVAAILTLGPTTKFVLYKYSLASGAPTTVVATYTCGLGGGPFSNFDHLAGLTTDGTSIYLCWVKNNDDVRVSAWDTSLVLGSSFTLDAGFEVGDRIVCDIEYQVIDGGTWWIIWVNTTTGVYQVSAYTGAPATLVAENFVLPADSRGICFDGTVFITAPKSGTYWRKHTTWRSSQTKEHVKYSWYQNAGAYESLVSGQSYVTYVQRASLRVSWGAFPSTVDRARVYFLENGSTANPGVGAMKLQGTETGSVQTYTTYNSGGGADPSTNSFPNATPSTLVLPRLTAAPGSPVEGQMYHNTTSHKTQIYDGTSWNNLW